LTAIIIATVIHCLVPGDFGNGSIIPLLKDNTGNLNRAITLISVITKLFELVILDLRIDQLMTDELQFGFKPNVGCANAIFTLHTTRDYFCERGSTVYAASFNKSKAFDSQSP